MFGIRVTVLVVCILIRWCVSVCSSGRYCEWTVVTGWSRAGVVASSCTGVCERFQRCLLLQTKMIFFFCKIKSGWKKKILGKKVKHKQKNPSETKPKPIRQTKWNARKRLQTKRKLVITRWCWSYACIMLLWRTHRQNGIVSESVVSARRVGSGDNDLCVCVYVLWVCVSVCMCECQDARATAHCPHTHTAFSDLLDHSVSSLICFSSA